MLGGSAAVWITCLVFFQTALLCAYAYAHWLARHPHWLLHLVLLLAALGLAGFWAFGGIDLSNGPAHPVATIFLALSLWIGLPFLALGATSPLLQVWWSHVEDTGIPYRLFALSNLASLLALGRLSHAHRAQLHAAHAAHRLVLRLRCSLPLLAAIPHAPHARGRRASLDRRAGRDASSARHRRSRTSCSGCCCPWVASMQLSAVTSYITANIAPIPLLWILPLGVYLLTIILAFEFPRLLPRGIVARFLAVMLGGLGYMLSQVDVACPSASASPFFLPSFSSPCLFCHSEAYALRPQRASESTRLLSAVRRRRRAWLVPHRHCVSAARSRFNYDLAITFFCHRAAGARRYWRGGWAQRLLWSAASVMMLVLVFWLHIAYQRETIVAVRNFYGALRVKQNYGSFPGATLRTLTNGTIEHGTQIFGTDRTKKNADHLLRARLRRRTRAALLLPGPKRIRTRPPRTSASSASARERSPPTASPATTSASTRSTPPSCPSRTMFSPTSANPARRSTSLSGDARTSLAARAAAALRRAGRRRLLRRRDPAAPAHCGGSRALSPPSRARRHYRLPHLEPARRSGTGHRAAGAERRHERRASLPRANDDRGEFTAHWVLVSDNAAFFASPRSSRAPTRPFSSPACASGPTITPACCRCCAGETLDSCATGRWSVCLNRSLSGYKSSIILGRIAGTTEVVPFQDIRKLTPSPCGSLTCPSHVSPDKV